MLCPNCGHENPNLNRFCGMCGAILERRRNTSGIVVAMPPRPAERRAEEQARGGTSAAITTVEPPREYPVEAAPPSGPTHGADVSDTPRGDEMKPNEERADVGPIGEAAHTTPEAQTFSMFGVEMSPRESRDEPIRDSARFEGLHGPSILGLGDEAGGSGDYLLEDEERGSGRKWVMLVVLVVLGVLAYGQWRADSPVKSLTMQAWSKLKARATGTPENAPAPQAAPTGADQASGTPAAGEKQNAEAAKGSQSGAEANPTSTGKATDEKNSGQSPAAASPESASAAASSVDKDNEGQSAREAQAGNETPKPEGEQIAKADHPQSDADEEPAKPAHAKPAAAVPARRDTEDDALVTRAQGYLYGRGGQKSCSMAMSLLKQAADRGSSKASSQLGAMYATGNCAPFDRAQAYHWFSTAAEADPANQYLKQTRDMMWREMTPQERARVLE